MKILPSFTHSKDISLRFYLRTLPYYHHKDYFVLVQGIDRKTMSCIYVLTLTYL